MKYIFRLWRYDAAFSLSALKMRLSQKDEDWELQTNSDEHCDSLCSCRSQKIHYNVQVMRALASSTAVSVLLLSLAAVTSSPQSGDQPVVYEDQCDYTGPYYKCGDKCLFHSSECDCGGTPLHYKLVPTHHCCPSYPCTQTRSLGDVTCKGTVIHINTTCNGMCYADVRDSKYLDYDKSRYSCQEGNNECLTVSTMCQGRCSAEICSNKTLRCDEIYTPNNTKIIKMGSLNRSEVIEKEHFYCKVDSLEANQIFDSIDRTVMELPNIR